MATQTAPAKMLPSVTATGLGCRGLLEARVAHSNGGLQPQAGRAGPAQSSGSPLLSLRSLLHTSVDGCTLAQGRSLTGYEVLEQEGVPRHARHARQDAQGDEDLQGSRAGR